jgi:transposase
LELLAQAVALTTDEAIVQAHSLIAQSLAAQLATLRQQIQRFDEQIAQRFETHPDRFIFASFPGAGPVFGPRLLCAFGTRRDRFPTSEHIQRLSGIAPITERSGASKWVHIRWACPKFLRQSFHEFARFSLKFCAWASCYYNHQLRKGKSTQSAIRALAYKWQRILWRCWQDRTPYDEAKYVQILLQRGLPIYSPLAFPQSADSQPTSIQNENLS